MKEEQSNNFYIRRDNITKNHKLLYSGKNEDVVAHLHKKRKMYVEWLSSIMAKSERDHLDKQNVTFIPLEIEAIDNSLENLKSRKDKKYIDYSTYSKILKKFSLNMQEALCEGYPVRLKGLGTFIVVRFPVTNKKCIDWKRTKEKKQYNIENNINENSIVYYQSEYFLKLLLLRNRLGIKNFSYYTFRVAGGKTREGSNSMKYKLRKAFSKGEHHKFAIVDNNARMNKKKEQLYDAIVKKEREKIEQILKIDI